MKVRDILLTNVIPINVFYGVVFIKVPKYHFRLWVQFMGAFAGLCIFTGLIVCIGLFC